MVLRPPYACGVAHSFFDRTFVEFGDVSADAWERVRGFIAAHAPSNEI